jgi:acylphosphatase
MKQSYMVHGKVQGVMFRKTLILAAKNRNLNAGATNDKEDRNCVHFSLEGDKEKIEDIEIKLISLPKLNSWGAKPERLDKVDQYRDVSTYEVTTENINELNFTSGVEFFL